MTEHELELKLLSLTKLAENMPEPDRTFKLNEIDQLKIQLQGTALNELRTKLEQVTLIDNHAIDKKIVAAKETTATQETVLKTIDFSLNVIKIALMTL